MANANTPYGLLPVGVLGSRSYNSGMRKYKMTNSYGTSIFRGDVLKCVNTGTVEKDTGTATATPIGIFMGCEYTEPSTGQKIWRNYWTASTVATDNYAYVVDDPDIVFQVQISTGSAFTLTNLLFMNAALVQTAGDTINGMSRVSIASLATTNTLPVRVLEPLDWSVHLTDTYIDVLACWNWGMHQHRQATGI